MGARVTDPPMRVRLSTPGDMAAAIPYLVGFHPHESLVVVSLRGPRKRIGLTMRFDLAPPSEDADFAEEIAVRLAADKAEYALLACCTAEASGPDRALPRSDLIESVVRALDRRDIGVMDALLIRDGQWWSYHCENPDCCPLDGSPIPDGTALAAANAMLGRAVLPDRDALAAQIKPVGFLARRAMEQTLDRVGEAFADRVLADGIEVVRAETVALVAALVDRYSDPATASLTDNEAARVVIGLFDVLARDEVLVAALDRDLDVVLRLFVDICKRAVPPDDAPVCAVLAWLAYADGNGGLANVALERALTSEPDYSLANLLRDALHQQVPPSQLRKAWRESAGIMRHPDE